MRRDSVGKMKTLDEVIKALETDPVPMAYTARLSVHEDIMIDALHYLQTYRADKLEWEQTRQANEERYQEAVRNCERAENKFIARLKELDIGTLNEPLTWDELRQMEGKPVWIEHLCGVLRWGVIDDLFYDQKESKTKTIFGTRHGFLEWDKDDLGKTWQAYRKERK